MLLLVIGLIIIAIGAGAIFFLVRQGGGIIGLTNAPTPVPQISSKVYVMARDMKLGEIINEADLTETSFPTNLIPREPVTSPAEAAGKILKNDLVQGEILLKSNLADPTNSNNDLAFALAEDHVMMAISFEDVMTRENIVKRGDIVDVFVTTSKTVPAPVVTTGETILPGGTTGETGTEAPETVTRYFTFDAFQKTNITAIVMDVVNTEAPPENQTAAQEAANERASMRISAYLLALDPQDALVLKFFKDTGAIFDLVLRSPTSQAYYELTPVTEEYIVELYGLQILE